MDNESTLDTLVPRLDRLERENRYLKLAGTILLLALAAGGAMGQAVAKAVPKVVEAERFVLRDTTGKPRARLSLLPDGGTGLTLFDQNGKARAGLGLLPDGWPALTLVDQNGKLRAKLSLLPDGRPALTLADQNEKPRALLSLYQPDGGPALDLFDQNEKPRAVLGQTALETATGTLEQRPASSLVLFDRDGKVIWRVP